MDTIIQDATGVNVSNIVTISGSGTSSSDRLTVKDLRVTGVSINGFSTLGSVAHIELNNVARNGGEGFAAGERIGVWVDGGVGVTVTDLVLDGIQMTGLFNGGVYFDSDNAADVDGLVIKNSSFTFSRFGIHNYIDASITTNHTRFNNVHIVDNLFEGNGWKGIYLEKISDAVIERNLFKDNAIAAQGTVLQSNGSGNTGLEFNLKHGAFSNIDVLNNTFDNTGKFTHTGMSNDVSGALAIKPRNIGGGGGIYASNPATLDDMLVSGNVFVNIPAVGGKAVLVGEYGTNMPTNLIITNNSLGDGTAQGIKEYDSWRPGERLE